MTTKQPPPFTVRADELCIGDYIILESTTPVARPIITRVFETDHVGDDITIFTTHGIHDMSEGTLITCLGDTLTII